MYQSQLLAPAPGEIVFSRHFVAYIFSIRNAFSPTTNPPSEKARPTRRNKSQEEANTREQRKATIKRPDATYAVKLRVGGRTPRQLDRLPSYLADSRHHARKTNATSTIVFTIKEDMR